MIVRTACVLLGLSIGCFAARDARAAAAMFAGEVTADGPLAWWRLGEAPGATTAADAAPHGLDGAYSASGVTLGLPGVGGGDTAVLFDGSGDGVVTVPHDAALNVTQITLEAVLRWNGPNGLQQRIVEKSTEPGSTRPVFSLQVAEDGHAQVELGFLGIPDEKIVLASLATVAVGQATHLAATFDGNVVQLYVNGLPDAGVSFSGSLRTDTERPVGLGNQAERERPFNGLIDEVVLYDYALGPERLLAHWQAVPEPSGMMLGAAALGLLAVFCRRGYFGTVAPRARNRQAAAVKAA